MVEGGTSRGPKVMSRNMPGNEGREIRGSKATQGYKVNTRSLCWIREGPGSLWREGSEGGTQRRTSGLGNISYFAV